MGEKRSGWGLFGEVGGLVANGLGGSNSAGFTDAPGDHLADPEWTGAEGQATATTRGQIGTGEW